LKVFLRSDDEIRRDVLADLTAGGVPANVVQIAVRGGVVVVEGDLSDEIQTREIEEIAGQVDGVVAVRRRIRAGTREELAQ
jgi:osmotically-inducible protein OsmY